MYKFIGGMVAGMAIVPLFYLAEKQKNLGFEFSAVPILIAFSIVLGAWFFSSVAEKHETKS